MIRNVMEFVQYYADAYKALNIIFLQFCDLLENSKYYDIKFVKVDENNLEFTLFGYPVEIFFTIFKSDKNRYPFGEIIFNRHNYEEIDTFFSFYFDENGNTLHEIDKPYNSWNIKDKESLRKIIALIMQAYISKFIEKPQKGD